MFAARGAIGKCWLGAALWLAALAGLSVLLRPSEWAWWAITALGAAALVPLIATTVFIPRAGPQPAQGYARHARLGRWAVCLSVLHVVAVPAIDGSIWLYVSPSVSLDLLAGVLGFAAIIVAFATREPVVMRHIPRVATWPHRSLSAGALVLVLGHVGLIPGQPWWTIGALAATVALCLLALARPTDLKAARRWAAGLAAALAAGGIVLVAGPLVEARMTALRKAPADPRIFVHASHADVTCTTCHHNFVDRSGFENCVSCHKAISTDEWSRIDRIFHAFCTDCHAERRLAGRKAGPIQSCDACHAKRRVSTSPSN